MELKDWLSPLIAGILGGLAVKIFDILYQEFRRRSESQDAAKQFVDEHLDPLLKAADELVGKLLSLAKEDFKSIQVSIHIRNMIMSVIFLVWSFSSLNSGLMWR